jgi:hypothetical protein
MVGSLRPCCLQPLAERDVQCAERVIEAGVTGRALPDHAADVEGAHEGATRLIVSDLDPTLGSDSMGHLWIGLFE